jgi:hypothetical protein
VWRRAAAAGAMDATREEQETTMNSARPRGGALLLVAVFTLLDGVLLGCGSAPLPSPVEHGFDAGSEAGDEPELDAATDAGEEDAAAYGNDVGPTCVAQPPASGAVSPDCFAFETCSWCGVPSGVQFWCGGDAGPGAHADIAGCVVDPGALSGWVGSCCPSYPPTCTRLAADDSDCVSQDLPGSAYACPVASAKPTATPSAPGCLPSGTTFDAGVPQEPSVPGAALAPAQGNALFCCPSDPEGDQ